MKKTKGESESEKKMSGVCLVCQKSSCYWGREEHKEMTYNRILELHKLTNLCCKDKSKHIDIFDIKDYTKTRIPRDGNCFFHCFSKFLNSPEVSFDSLREEIWKHISLRNENNDDEICELKNWCPDFENDLILLLTDGEYNFDLFDHVPKIMSNLLKINLFIHGPSESSFVNPEWSQTIHLYLENCHFTLLNPKETKEMKPKEVKPKEVKPKEVKPKEIKPKEVKPKEVKPKEKKEKK
jgi:hypothetical protein